MPIRTRSIAALFAIVLTCFGVSGCGTINERMAAGVSDIIPVWAGGLPADAPPRPGTEKYDEYMRERERQRRLPAAERGADARPAPSSQESIR
ncbi:hypothetical protein [Bradyrhizobium sp.]|uniref:hypothetical protein n=1 Tax=Bradyrhizobium sp. TaxID=376 RepID=UPI0025BDC00A|nr:hypothetical protein [Bradyrhizobium sp.]